MSHPSESYADRLTRRESLKGLLGAALGLAAGGPLGAAAQLSTEGRPPRALRITHLTDIHVFAERDAEAGMTACLEHVHSLDDPPDLILNGGDMIYDALAVPLDEARAQWAIWNRVLEANLSIPIRHCLGNHDIWGWGREGSGATGTEPEYGRALATEMTGVEQWFHSFDQAGWHFIVLDSNVENQATERWGYRVALSPEQWEWLEADLAATPAETPTLILTHEPILSVAALMYLEPPRWSDGWGIHPLLMHTEMPRLIALFGQHPNVRLCLSGHSHLLDRVDYNGLTHLCNGAVSGNWWRGTFQQTPPGYAVIDLFADGSFENDYVQYAVGSDLVMR